jgi:hypothetical protein
MVGATNHERGVGRTQAYVIAAIRVNASLFVRNANDHSDIAFMPDQLKVSVKLIVCPSV